MKSLRINGKSLDTRVLLKKQESVKANAGYADAEAGGDRINDDSKPESLSGVIRIKAASGRQKITEDQTGSDISVPVQSSWFKRYFIADANLNALCFVFILMVLVCAFAFGSAMYSGANLQSMAFQIPEFGLVALGMMLAFLVGGIDLSIVANACLSGIIAGFILTGQWLPEIEEGSRIAIAIVAALTLSTLMGLFNGLLIATCAVSSLIATLGTMTFYSGIGMALTGGRSVVGFPDNFTYMGIATLGEVPLIFIMFILVMVIMAILLERTGNGRKLYLFGGNPVASLFSGINNKRMNIATFTAIGFLAGLAGLTIIMRVNSAKVGYGDAYVFQSLIVCVIAGIHPAGGRGKAIGIGITAVLMQMAASSFTILQLSPYTTKLIWGLMLILVLGLTKDGRMLLNFITRSIKQSVSAKRSAHDKA